MIITAITAQLKNKNRISLFLDGEFACGLSAIAVIRAGLKVGYDITPERLEELKGDSELSACMDCALKYLGYKPVSRYKMGEYLKDKGFDEDISAKTVERLSQMKYIDDAAIAIMYVKTYAKKYGNHLIKYKLREMGISSDDIDAALPSDETESARQIAQKYLRTHKPDRRKLYVYLSNKGFSSSSVVAALDVINDVINEGDYEEKGNEDEELLD